MTTNDPTHDPTTMTRLDDIAATATLVTTSKHPFTQALSMAEAIKAIRAALPDEVMNEMILPLMNSKLGFRTDKDPNRPAWNKSTRQMESPQPYPLATVRECLIEATLRGLPPVGNCWNILNGQSYVTKEGFWFLLGSRIEGLSDFKILVGVPRMVKPPGDEDAKGALVTCSASWKLHGKDGHLEREIPIRVNALTGADAIMGKAERKILAAAHAQITGTTLGDADASENETPPRELTPARRAPARAPEGNPHRRATPPQVVELTTAQRKEAALAIIESGLSGAFEEPVTRVQFEGILRRQHLLGPTGTLTGLKIDRLENIAASMRHIAAQAREEVAA